MSHVIEICSNGDLVDVVYVCGDWCHKTYCHENNLPYEGWNGCHEIPAEHGEVLCGSCQIKLSDIGDADGSNKH